VTKKRVKFVDGGNSEAISQVAVLFPLKGSTPRISQGQGQQTEDPRARVAALPRGGELSGWLLDSVLVL
jgi:hypothetical protein